MTEQTPLDALFAGRPTTYDRDQLMRMRDDLLIKEIEDCFATAFSDLSDAFRHLCADDIGTEGYFPN